MADQLTTLRATLKRAYDLGWIEAARWANRGDLTADIDSPAYLADSTPHIEKLIASMEAQPVAQFEVGPLKCEPLAQPELAGWFSYDESKECWRQVSDQYRTLGGVDCIPLFTHHAQPALHMSDAMRDFITGMSVSVDVSTCEEDACHRYFGKVDIVQDDEFDKHGVTLLVQNSEPNFKVQPASEQIKEVVVHADYRQMWAEVVRQNQQLCAALSAQPASEPKP